eukprot:57495_1
MGNECIWSCCVCGNNLGSTLKPATECLDCAHRKYCRDPKQLYHSLSLLGRGGFGAVYKAQSKCNNVVAIKKVPNDEYKSIKTETSLLRQCDSQYVIKLIDEFFEDKCCWLVLEYCNGGSIEGKAGKCWGSTLKQIIKDVSNGLKYLHSKNIIHRDIKPHNILCQNGSYYCRYKLGDFGISKNTDISSAKTKLGTMLYIAPEILKNGDDSYTEKVDIWSFGVTIYFLATGSYPFKDQSSQFKLINEIVNGTPIKLKVCDGIDANINDIVNNKTLKKNPSERFSAAEILSMKYFS